MYKAIIYILAGVAALIAGAVSAQAPETCAAEDRAVSGNLLSPCKEPFVVDFEDTMEYRFVQRLAKPPAPLEDSRCISYMVFRVGDDWVSPSPERTQNIIRIHRGDSVETLASVRRDWVGVENTDSCEIL